jgi:hypothetical protein
MAWLSSRLILGLGLRDLPGGDSVSLPMFCVHIYLFLKFCFLGCFVF